MNMSYAKMDIRKTLTTGVAPPRLSKTGSPEYIGKVAGCPFSEDRSGAKTVAPMTAYEIISIFIGILALLMSFGSLIAHPV